MTPAANAPERSGGGSVPADLAAWARALAGRIYRVWRVLPSERRLAAVAALSLFVVLFLPWYQETVVVPGAGRAAAASASVTGWGHFSFVEAAVLLVAIGVLVLLFQRAEGRAFHVPGGDGSVIVAGGAWTCALIVWQIFDKPSATVHGAGADISGIEWGIFVALAASVFLAYAGTSIRRAHTPEPPLPGDPPDGGIVLSEPGEDETVVAQRAQPAPKPDPPPRARGWLTAPRAKPEGSEQLTIPLDPEP